MKLDKGDLTGALEDLQVALDNQPPKEILPKTRTKLFETLTELFQRTSPPTRSTWTSTTRCAR